MQGQSTYANDIMCHATSEFTMDNSVTFQCGLLVQKYISSAVRSTFWMYKPDFAGVHLKAGRGSTLHRPFSCQFGL